MEISKFDKTPFTLLIILINKYNNNNNNNNNTSDCHPRGPGFNSRLYPRNISGSIGSETGSTQPREDNWVAN